jgi:hypothetical protein
VSLEERTPPKAITAIKSESWHGSPREVVRAVVSTMPVVARRCRRAVERCEVGADRGLRGARGAVVERHDGCTEASHHLQKRRRGDST